MPVQLEGARATISGVSGAEDAADLADFLREGGREVVLDGAEHVHAAVLQCLMALSAPVGIVRTDGALGALVARACGPRPTDHEDTR